ncbi:hypothetical protein ACQ86N_30125 [Puia sp. P3]|uniref:hypothetical protein n=1 Tax=Puia sp. P3 TaxID=3423952 RepID=UPI003D671A23
MRSSFIATAVVYIVTTIHHLYGASVYNTPRRKDVGTNGGIVPAACLLLLYLYKRYEKRIFLILYMAISFLVFGLGIGLFEGLYNHILKNILFFSGMSPTTWRRFFPAPAYEVPDNIFFETTGILQFFIATLSTYYIIQLYRSTTTTP